MAKNQYGLVTRHKKPLESIKGMQGVIFLVVPTGIE